MFLFESIWIKQKISDLNLPSQSRILDIGSSVLELREIHQPYINENVFRPLINKGFKITHIDKKDGRGIEKIIDIERTPYINKKFDLIICTSVLEHLKDIKSATENILYSVKKNGYLLVSVPYVCGYHPDPIDTMFRPANQELEQLFPNQKIIASTILSSLGTAVDLTDEKVSIIILQITSPISKKSLFKRCKWIISTSLINLKIKIARFRNKANRKYLIAKIYNNKDHN